MADVYATTSALIPESIMVFKICKGTWSSHQRTDIILPLHEIVKQSRIVCTLRLSIFTEINIS